MLSLDSRFSYSLTLHGGLEVYGGAYKNKMARAKFVNAVTRVHAKQIVDEVGLDKSKVPVIYMGVDLEKFVQKNYPKRDKIHFISIARLAKGKGHSYALEALKQAKDKGYSFVYNIVGGGDYEAALKTKVEQLGLVDEVVFHGTLSEDGVKNLLSDSDVLLLTSVGKFEAAPVAVMESMASGVSCICSIIGGTPDMVNNGKDGFLVSQTSVSEIHKAMMNYFENPELVAIMGSEARKNAVNKFSHKDQASRLLKEIRK